MKTEQTAEQKMDRARIAEHNGWLYVGPPDLKYEAVMMWVRPGAMPHQVEELPDYLNDSNELEAVLNRLNDAEWAMYARALADICRYDITKHIRRLLSATRQQRMDAYVTMLALHHGLTRRTT